jgi:hypothetical protein
MKDGGCITARWSQTLDVPESVIDVLSDEPALMADFERLHERHARRLPRVMHWGQTVMTSVSLAGRRVASIMTSCTRNRGLSSSAWVSRETRR